MMTPQQEAMHRVGGGGISRPELRFSVKVKQLFPCDCEPPFLQPLHERLRGRAFGVELFSSTPGADERFRLDNISFAFSQGYADWQVAREQVDHVLAGRRSPILVVAAPHRPLALIRTGLMIPDEQIQGVFRGRSHLRNVLYVSYYHLAPEEIGWDMLRCCVPPHRSIVEGRKRFFENPENPLPIKKELWDIIVDLDDPEELDGLRNPYL